MALGHRRSRAASKQSDDHQIQPACLTAPPSRQNGACRRLLGTRQGWAGIGDYSRLALTDSDVQRIAGAGWRQPAGKAQSEGAYIGLNETCPTSAISGSPTRESTWKRASTVGKQSHSALVPYETTNHRDIFLTADGHVDAGQMFKTAESENSIITWLVRACGLIGCSPVSAGCLRSCPSSPT